MHIPKFFVALILGMALVVPSAVASSGPRKLEFDAIRAQQAEIRSGVEARAGRYKDMPSGARIDLLAKQAQVLRMIEGKQSSEELNDAQKTEVFNTLEWIEAAVNNAEDERMVCERRAVLGSNRKERVCKTVGQLRVEHDAARDQVDGRGVCSDCKVN